MTLQCGRSSRLAFADRGLAGWRQAEILERPLPLLLGGCGATGLQPGPIGIQDSPDPMIWASSRFAFPPVVRFGRRTLVLGKVNWTAADCDVPRPPLFPLPRPLDEPSQQKSRLLVAWGACTSVHFLAGVARKGLLYSGDEGDRTLNPRLAKAVLSQLSYVPAVCDCCSRSSSWRPGLDRPAGRPAAGPAAGDASKQSGRTKIRTSDLVLIRDAL